jgi:Ser/Thr protein kinase RdoA (MazF antagonist)
MDGRDVDEVVRRFALGTAPVVEGPPVRGELGQVWRVRTSSGTWAVKENFDPVPEDEVRPAAEFQEAAVSVGVPAPPVVRTTDGTVLADVGGRVMGVFGWVDLAGADVGIDPAAVGELVASIHRMGYAADGPASAWYTQPVGEQGWDVVLREVARSGYQRGGELLALRGELCALEALIEAPATLQRLHLDLWADNVRATPAGGLCVIDWDNSGPGDPRQELGVVLFEYCAGSPERARRLAAAYAAAGGTATVTRPEDFSMCVAQLGHILEWQCGNWLRASTDAARAHVERAVAVFGDRPVLGPWVAELVDAVV